MLCPYTHLRDGYWAEIVALHAAAKVSPLSGWPDAYPAGIMAGVLALSSAVEEHRARQMKAEADKIKRGGRVGHRRG